MYNNKYEKTSIIDVVNIYCVIILYMKKIKGIPVVAIFELLTFVCALFATVSIFTDFRFMVDISRLASIPYLMTYTGLSNLFIGLVCLICALYRLIYKKDNLPQWLFIIKIVFLSQITITFLITALYLSPHLGSDWWKLYNNAGLFNHFITPVVAMLGFLLFEPKGEMKWFHYFYSIAPIVIYAIMYTINVYTHLNPDGSTSLDFDIYGFFRYGVGVFILFLLFFFATAFGLAYLYRLENKAINKHE